MRIIKKISKIISNIIECTIKDVYALKYPKLCNMEYNYNKNDFLFDERIEIENIYNIKVDNTNTEKWVGAVNYNNCMYCIPNKINKVLKINLTNDSLEYIDLNYKNTDKFLWSGGCIYKDKIYGFTRSANDLICINPKNDDVSLIRLNINYNNEHHYGGVCTSNGIIYQPPRNNNTLLVIDLNNYSSREIKISPKLIKYNYVTGIIANNGLIYFFPNSVGKVMVMNPKDEKIFFIGGNIRCSVFGPTIGPDNNIYGFSSYAKGILKININNNKVRMIHKEIGRPGCFGSKVGINGKIYGIPGNGKYIWEYNPASDVVKKIKEINDDYAKCAGGVVSNDGTIYTVPAFGDSIIKIEFSEKKRLLKDNIDFFNINNY